MASDTKSKESWGEVESSSRSATRMNPLKLSRVFRFQDPQTAASQISDFPDSNPSGDTPLEVRMKHFTEIENFHLSRLHSFSRARRDDSDSHSYGSRSTSARRGISELHQRGKERYSD